MKTTAISLLALLLPSVNLRAADSPPPNIVLVMADDQGWGDMGYQGDPRVKTPNFDALAREGIRFDHFYAAAPVCSPTRGSVMTGRHPNRFGCFSYGNTLRPQEITIAETLRSAGYRTGHFGKWHLGSVQRASPVSPGAKGFDEWISSPNFFDLDPVLSVEGKATPFTGDSSDVTVDVALKFIRRCAEQKQRFLAVVWFGSPHDPFEALPADREPYRDLPEDQQNYYGEITAMDRAFGRLRRELREMGLRDNTVLWFCSDNGPLAIGSSGGKRGKKGQVYDGGLAVPGLMEWPALTEKLRVITAPCVTSDIYPTVMEITGAKAPAGAPALDGISLLPILTQHTEKRSKPIGFWSRGIGGPTVSSKAWMADLLAAQTRGEEPNDPKRVIPDAGKIPPPVPLDQYPGHAAWLDWPWKLHRIEDKTTHKVTWELYNMADDPTESKTLLASESSRDRVPAMQKALETWLTSVVRSLNGEDYH